GTASPVVKLQVAGSGAFTGRLAVGKTNALTALDVAGTISGSALTVMGNVGIGTASPSYPLHLEKDQNNETAMIVMNATDGTASQMGYIAGSDSSHQLLLEYVAPSHSITAWENKALIAATSQTSGLLFTSYGAGGTIGFQTGGT